MRRTQVSTPSSQKKTRPALTEEAREQQLISLTIDLVEQRLKDGTASSQETTHFLKLASSKNRLDMEIREKEKELITAKTEALKAQEKLEETYAKAIKAFTTYRGDGDEEDY